VSCQVQQTNSRSRPPRLPSPRSLVLGSGPAVSNHASVSSAAAQEAAEPDHASCSSLPSPSLSPSPGRAPSFRRLVIATLGRKIDLFPLVRACAYPTSAHPTNTQRREHQTAAQTARMPDTQRAAHGHARITQSCGERYSERALLSEAA
jgi:hypothetical protein